MVRKTTKPTCKHTSLLLTPSPNAALAGYTPYPPATLSRAATTARTPPSHTPLPAPATTFPAPLILPGDDLSHDPKYPAQSLTSFKRSQHRNPITQQRKKIYYILPPSFSASAKGTLDEWRLPSGMYPDLSQAEYLAGTPEWSDVSKYLTAFFEPIEVEAYPGEVALSLWDDDDGEDEGEDDTAKKKKAVKRVRKKGVKHASPKLMLTSSTLSAGVQIRTRPCPDDCAVFTHQLNLGDVLDFLIEARAGLKDCYSIIMLTDLDLYEDENDDFCVGRAYGGDGVCVVSVARYNWGSEDWEGVYDGLMAGHEWPGSHCEKFVEGYCVEYKEGGKDDAVDAEERKWRKKAGRGKKAATAASAAGASTTSISISTGDPDFSSTPMDKAIAGHRLELRSVSGATRRSLWLSRVCKTASHELLHCFCHDHCVYYACVMQGTASVIEDTRQPFYLCPIDMAKLREGLMPLTGKVGEAEWELGWSRRVLDVVKKFVQDGDGGGRGWRGFEGWLEGRIEELEGWDPNGGAGEDGDVEMGGTREMPIELD